MMPELALPVIFLPLRRMIDFDAIGQKFCVRDIAVVRQRHGFKKFCGGRFSAFSELLKNWRNRIAETRRIVWRCTGERPRRCRIVQERYHDEKREFYIRSGRRGRLHDVSSEERTVYTTNEQKTTTKDPLLRTFYQTGERAHDPYWVLAATCGTRIRIYFFSTNAEMNEIRFRLHKNNSELMSEGSFVYMDDRH